MEENPQQPYHLRRMKVLPPLPPKATFGRHKNKNMQTIETSTSKVSPYGTKFEINQLELALSISTDPKITSLLICEYDAVETKALKTSLHEMIEPKFLDLYTLEPEVIQLEEP